MSLSLLEDGKGLAKNHFLWLADIVGRLLVVSAIPVLVSILLHSSSKQASPLTFQVLLSALAQGVLPSLVLLPLARRLPYRLPIRIVSLFLPIYWTMYLGNLVEAAFYTTIPVSTLIAGGFVYLLVSLITATLIAWLFPAYRPSRPVEGIWQALRQRSLLSWAWRLALVGLLYPLFVQAFGILFSPIIGPYYHNPAYQVLSGTHTQPFLIGFLEEAGRGIIFALTLLPTLAALRGRSFPALFFPMLYFSLIGVTLEAILGIAFSEPTWPVALRIGETLNTSFDGIARGVTMALLLTLPALSEKLSQSQSEADSVP